MSKNFVIAIDGPSASGKSSITEMLASKLRYYYINTGEMYRLFTFKILNENQFTKISVNLDDIFYSKQIENISMDFFLSENKIVSTINNKYDSLDNRIYSEEVSLSTSIMSANKIVREFMVEKQRLLISKFNKIILEGRDIGTYVCSTADFKFFLTASLEVRTRRRLNQIVEEKHRKINNLNNSDIFSNVKKEISKRDKIDSTRSMSPLKPAFNAIIINSDNLSKDDIVDFMIAEISKKINL